MPSELSTEPGSAEPGLRLRCRQADPATRAVAAVTVVAAEGTEATEATETAATAETETVGAAEVATTEVVDVTVEAGGIAAEADLLVANAAVVTVAGVTEELAEAEVAGGRPPDRRRGQSRGTGLTPGTGWTKHSTPHTLHAKTTKYLYFSTQRVVIEKSGG